MELARVEGVDVARDRDEVAARGEPPQEVGALAAVAVPLVAAEVELRLELRGQELEAREVDRHLRELHARAEDLPGRVGGCDASEQPVLLRRAEQGRPRRRLALVEARLEHEVAGPEGTVRGELADGQVGRPLGNQVIVAVVAVVDHEHLDVPPEAQAAVDADVVGIGRRLVEDDVGRLVLEPGAVGGLALRGRLLVPLLLVEVGRVVLPGVVRELVVVPDVDERVELVGPPEPFVAAVLPVDRAVVGESERGAARFRRVAERKPVGQLDRAVPAHGLEVGIPVGLVDVVAEVHDEVEVVGVALHECAPRVVPAADEVLARREGEAHRDVLSGLGRGLRPPDRGRDAESDEAVPVGGVGREADRLDPHRVVAVGVGRGLAPGDDLGERLVERDLVGDAVPGRGSLDPRPEDHALRRGVARGDALREDPGHVGGVGADGLGRGRVPAAGERDGARGDGHDGETKEVTTMNSGCHGFVISNGSRVHGKGVRFGLGDGFQGPVPGPEGPLPGDPAPW